MNHIRTHSEQVIKLICLNKKTASMPTSPKISNKFLNNKIISIEAPKMESIRDYVDKTRDLLSVKYSMKIKKKG